MKARVLGILFSLLISVCGFSQQLQEEVVKGKIQKESGIPSSYLRQQLMYDLFDQVVVKSLVQKGKDWEGFKKSFAKIRAEVEEQARERVTARYGNIEKLSPQGLKDYRRELKKAELDARAGLTSLYNSVISYSVQDFSPVGGDRYQMSLKVKLDVRSVLNYYDEILGSLHIASQGGKVRLFVDTKVHLEGLDWAEDFSLNNPGQFITPLSQSWVEWFENNLPVGISSVELSSEGSAELAQANMGDIVLRVNGVIKKLYEDVVGGRFKYGLEVSVGVMAVGSEEVLGSFDVVRESKVYNEEDASKRANLVANGLYRAPLGHFHEARRLISRKKPHRGFFTVVVQQVENFDKAQEIRKYLNNRWAGELSLSEIRGDEYRFRYNSNSDLSEVKQKFEQLSEIPEYGAVQMEILGNEFLIKKSTL